MELNAILKELSDRIGSDLHLKVGRPPLFRISGDLNPTDYSEVTHEELSTLLSGIMPPKLKSKFERDLEADFSYEIPGFARFRVNAFIQRGDIGVVFRLIPIAVPTIEELGLPGVLYDLAEQPDGVVLVTGPTGCGKSTTLAAMIEHINDTRPVHIMTIEDPIEFLYADKMATINQRELGLDTLDLLTALRAVLRQDPDVILMGEMRDVETMAFAITAAETGHLVFSTLHTNDAKQTIDRVLDTFPPEKGKQIRGQLALTLRGVISQRLVKRADRQGLIAAVEVMINSPNVRQIIEEGATRDLEKAIESSGYYKMQTFNQAYAELVKRGIITAEEALSNTSNPDDLKLALRGVQRGSAAEELDLDFEKKSSDQAKPPGPQEKKKIPRGFEF